MVFRLVLLAVIAWHAAFCVAEDPQFAQVGLIFGNNTNNQHWARYTRRGSHSVLTSVQDHQLTGLEYAACDSLEAPDPFTNATLDPNRYCKVRVTCDNGGVHKVIPCIGVYWRQRRLNLCGVSKKVYDSVLDCDLQFKPPTRDMIVAIGSNRNPGVVKGLMLSLPQRLDQSQPYVMSRKLPKNAQVTNIACNELPTASLGKKVEGKQGKGCFLNVQCIDTDSRISDQVECLAYIAERRGTSYLGECGKAHSESVKWCGLRVDPGFLSVKT